MIRTRWITVLPYLGAIAIVSSAVWVRFLMDPILKGRQPFAMFIVAVLIVARFCGFGPSLLAVFLSAMSSRYFFVAPRGSFSIASPVEEGSFWFFIALGLTIALVFWSEQRAKQAALEQTDVLRQKQQALEQEIAERVRIESELRASQNRFHLFMNSGPFSAFMKDEDGRYVYINRLMQTNWGRDESQWLGRTDHELFSDEMATLFRANDRRALQDGSFVRFHEMGTMPDGTSRHWSSIKFSVQDETGRRLLGGVSVDVTAARHAEQRFQRIYEQAPIGIALIESESGRFLQINPRYEQIIRRSEAEMVKLTFHDISHPDELTNNLDQLAALRRGEINHYQMDKRLLRGDGSWMWVRLTAVPMWDEGEPRSYHLAMVEDIDERKVAEDERRATEERFQAFMNNLPATAWAKDEQGRFTYVNKRYEECFHLPLTNLQGKTDFDISPPEAAEKFRQSDQRVMESGEPLSLIETNTFRDGPALCEMKFKFLYRDRVGKKYVGGIGIDITEQKQAEDKLRLRESQLSGILDNTTAVVYLKDFEGRYLLTNRRYREIFDLRADQIIGKRDVDIFSADVARGFVESDTRVWHEQSSIDFEEVAPHVDGFHTYRSVKFPVRDAAGDMIAMGGISTDISDLKQAHETLKAKEELLLELLDVQERERQFLCQEFHDGLIQYAVGSLMTLEGCQSDHPSPETAAAIDHVIGNLRKGIDDGRRVIRGVRPAVLDDSSLEAAIEDLADQFSNAGILVTSQCDPEVGRLPNSMQTTIYRVVQEALNNASKHSGTEVVRIKMIRSGGDLLLTVQDFGCGFVLESARKKGFGLRGMTERVRLLGGECSIQSEQEVGTTITIRLAIPAAELEVC